MVKVDLNMESFTSLMGGLYTTFHGVDLYSIPPFFWQQLGYALLPYMDGWRYDILSFEEWLDNYLIITAEDVLTESEIEEMRKYTIFVRSEVGNMVMIGAGDIVWESSTDISEKEKMENIK